MSRRRHHDANALAKRRLNLDSPADRRGSTALQPGSPDFDQDTPQESRRTSLKSKQISPPALEKSSTTTGSFVASDEAALKIMQAELLQPLAPAGYSRITHGEAGSRLAKEPEAHSKIFEVNGVGLSESIVGDYFRSSPPRKNLCEEIITPPRPSSRRSVAAGKPSKNTTKLLPGKISPSTSFEKRVKDNFARIHTPESTNASANPSPARGATSTDRKHSSSNNNPVYIQKEISKRLQDIHQLDLQIAALQKRIRQREPDAVQLTMNLGWVLQLQGQHAERVETLQQQLQAILREKGDKDTDSSDLHKRGRTVTGADWSVVEPDGGVHSPCSSRTTSAASRYSTFTHSNDSSRTVTPTQSRIDPSFHSDSDGSRSTSMNSAISTISSVLSRSGAAFQRARRATGLSQDSHSRQESPIQRDEFDTSPNPSRVGQIGWSRDNSWNNTPTGKGKKFSIQSSPGQALGDSPGGVVRFHDLTPPRTSNMSSSQASSILPWSPVKSYAQAVTTGLPGDSPTHPLLNFVGGYATPTATPPRSPPRYEKQASHPAEAHASPSVYSPGRYSGNMRNGGHSPTRLYPSSRSRGHSPPRESSYMRPPGEWSGVAGGKAAPGNLEAQLRKVTAIHYSAQPRARVGSKVTPPRSRTSSSGKIEHIGATGPLESPPGVLVTPAYPSVPENCNQGRRNGRCEVEESPLMVTPSVRAGQRRQSTPSTLSQSESPHMVTPPSRVGGKRNSSLSASEPCVEPRPAQSAGDKKKARRSVLSEMEKQNLLPVSNSFSIPLRGSPECTPPKKTSAAATTPESSGQSGHQARGSMSPEVPEIPMTPDKAARPEHIPAGEEYAGSASPLLSSVLKANPRTCHAERKNTENECTQPNGAHSASSAKAKLSSSPHKPNTAAFDSSLSQPVHVHKARPALVKKELTFPAIHAGDTTGEETCQDESSRETIAEETQQPGDREGQQAKESKQSMYQGEISNEEQEDTSDALVEGKREAKEEKKTYQGEMTEDEEEDTSDTFVEVYTYRSSEGKGELDQPGEEEEVEEGKQEGQPNVARSLSFEVDSSSGPPAPPELVVEPPKLTPNNGLEMTTHLHDDLDSYVHDDT